MKVVGPVRLRTIHTLEKEGETPDSSGCLTVSPLDVCYHQDMNEDTFVTKEFPGGKKFNKCEDLGIDYSIIGE